MRPTTGAARLRGMLALGSGGTSTAFVMLLIVLLANGMLHARVDTGPSPPVPA